MDFAITFVAIVLLALVSIDVFETIVLPRRVAGRFRLTAVFYRVTWRPWAWVAARLSNKKRREAFLSIYGPLSLLVLLVFWTAMVIFSFALLRWAFAADVLPSGVRASGGAETY